MPVLTTASQACMKSLAAWMGDMPIGVEWFDRAAHTPYFWGIFVLEITNFVLWMRILSTVDLSRALPLSAIAYILILALGWFGFDEPILTLQIVGSALILAGVYLIGTAKVPVNPI